MKKFILLVAVSTSFIMCKKGEATKPQLEKESISTDSSAVDVSENSNHMNNGAHIVLDSARIKIKDFEKTKSEAEQKMDATSKSIDSLSDKITRLHLETKPEKKDSVQNKIVVNVPAPKIIKQTKVVYREKPQKQQSNVKNKMVKTGVLELNVNDTELAKEIVKNEVKKYDGFIKSENTSLNNNKKKKVAYLRIKVPIQKFDYLMDDLNDTIGEIENKDIDVNGQDVVDHTMCDVKITLYGNLKNAVIKDEPKTFGGKSFAAVSSGWNVITSIFLFILPLWPLFIIAGIAYYFYKKKHDKQNGSRP